MTGPKPNREPWAIYETVQSSPPKRVQGIGWRIERRPVMGDGHDLVCVGRYWYYLLLTLFWLATIGSVAQLATAVIR